MDEDVTGIKVDIDVNGEWTDMSEYCQNDFCMIPQKNLINDLEMTSCTSVKARTRACNESCCSEDSPICSDHAIVRGEDNECDAAPEQVGQIHAAHATEVNCNIRLNWSPPRGQQSPIERYRIEAQDASGAFRPLSQLCGGKDNKMECDVPMGTFQEAPFNL